MLHLSAAQQPILLTWTDLIPAWISSYICYNTWDEITYPFPNLNSAAIED